MKNYTVKRYDARDKDLWNAFIRKAKNATFLFERDFMEYHCDRFDDHSLLFFDADQMVAVLPANRKDKIIYAHQGLTYGDLVLPMDAHESLVSELLEVLTEYLKSEQIIELILKPLPKFYSKASSSESLQFLSKNAQLIRSDVNLTIDFNGPDLLSKSKKKHFRRVSELGLEMRESNNFTPFWKRVLEPKLAEKYATKPVHTEQEITMLAARFPQNIVQCDAYYEDEIVAGITLFKFDKGIKSQYGATTAAGEKLRALDFLFISLIEKYKNEMDFFDMGTVMQADGQINTGLKKQKEELGCSVYAQNIYSLKL